MPMYKSASAFCNSVQTDLDRSFRCSIVHYIREIHSESWNSASFSMSAYILVTAKRRRT